MSINKSDYLAKQQQLNNSIKNLQSNTVRNNSYYDLQNNSNNQDMAFFK